MCIFCDIIKSPENHRAVTDETGDVYGIYDGFPVTKGHMLFIPKRHVSSFFGLTKEECTDTMMLLHKWASILSEDDPTITGFNIGWNCGDSAGQTIDHAHAHLIPRRNDDCENPIGGVRHCACNGKGYYGKGDLDGV